MSRPSRRLAQRSWACLEQAFHLARYQNLNITGQV